MNTLRNILGAVAMACSIASAVADPILIGSTPKSVLGDVGDATILNWLNGLISPSITVLDFKVDEDNPPPAGFPAIGGSPTSIPVNIDDYLVLHWGGPGGGTVVAYNIIGCTGNFSFSDPVPPPNGLSSYAYFGDSGPRNPPPPGGGTVPDAGTSLMLLGTSLISLRALVRGQP
jgi:hypothetical protein